MADIGEALNEFGDKLLTASQMQERAGHSLAATTDHLERVGELLLQSIARTEELYKQCLAVNNRVSDIIARMEYLVRADSNGSGPTASTSNDPPRQPAELAPRDDRRQPGPGLNMARELTHSQHEAVLAILPRVAGCPRSRPTPSSM